MLSSREEIASWWNLPNCLTLLRLLLVPLILPLILAHELEWQCLGTLLFILAAVTDNLDGRIARRRRQVTQFGQFADPLADKLLTLSVFVAIAWRPEFASVRVYLALWIGLIALREIGITILRIWAIAQGTAVITSFWGKAKTTSQLIAIITTLVLLNYRQITLQAPGGQAYYFGDGVLLWIVHGLIIICMLLTVISGILYFTENRFEARKPRTKPHVA